MLRKSLIALLSFSTAIHAGDSVDFVTNSGDMRPGTTFEIRFSRPIVTEDAVGKTAPCQPLVIQPGLKGQFKWLSTASGLFRPDEPPMLSTTYVFTLPPDLRAADGSHFSGTLHRVMETPRFAITATYPDNDYQRRDASALPYVNLLFNAPVDAGKCAPFFRFINNAGASVPAKVVQGNPAENPRHHIPSWSGHGGALTWEERFHQANGIANPKGDGARPNQLHIVPTDLLPPGDGWELIAATGIPSTDATLRTTAPLRALIGCVRPFIVSDVSAANSLNSGRTICVTLSKTLGAAVTDATAAEWIRIEPRPQRLKATVSNGWPNHCEITFSGDFALGQGYRVTTLAGLPSAEGFVLSQDHEITVLFQPIEPRIGFEDEETHHLSSGARKVRLLSVNVPKLRVTAKAFTADTAAGSAAAHQRYYEYHGDNAKRVEAESLPGRHVFEKDFLLPAQTDEAKVTTIDWDEILGPGSTGIVLLTAEALDVPSGWKKPGTQTLIQLTDLGVVWKDSREETFLHVFSLKTGAPVAGATLTLLDDSRKTLAHATTDAGGVARLPRNERGTHLLAQCGRDLNLIDFEYRNHFSHHRFRVAWDGEEEDLDDEFSGLRGRRRQVLLFTERAVYKPGETFHLKAIIRDFEPGKPSIPAGETVTLGIVDPRGKQFLSRELTVSGIGTVNADIELPKAQLGDYTVRLTGANERRGDDGEFGHQLTFTVQEYVPNAFEVLIGAPRLEPGSPSTRFEVRTKYLMGKALTKASVAWTLASRDAGFHPAGFEEFIFCDASALPQTKTPEFHEDGTLEVDASGRVIVESRIPFNESAPQPRETLLRCEVTDVNQQTVSATDRGILHSSAFYLGLAELPEVVREGDSLPLRLVAVNADGTLRNEPVETQVRLSRVEWQTNRIARAGGAEHYESSHTLSLCAQFPLPTETPVRTPQGWRIAPGAAGAMAPVVATPGHYLIEATTKDEDGRAVRTARSIFVHGRGATVWNYRNPFQVELVADKPAYVAGEIATLLVKNPFPGTALVTVERENVIRSFTVQLEGNAPAVRVPIEPGDAPNIYVSVLILRGAADSPKKHKMPEYRVGYAALQVSRPDAKLMVTTQPLRSAYRPGEEVTLDVEVRTGASAPVGNAEVTLYAVDEGVLSLTGYETPDPLAFFSRRHALGVNTGLNLPDIKSEDPAGRVFANKGYLIGDGDEGAMALVRKNFQACAFWNATLRTDADGRTQARFTAPDSLTRYRVIAVVATERDQFGGAESAFEVNKPVMIEPAPPRFGNVGDQIAVRAVIHNTTRSDGDAVVRLKLDSTTRASGPLSHTVRVPAGASVPVDFPVEFIECGEAEWAFTVDFTGGGLHVRDAVQSRLKVGFPAPSLRQIVELRADRGETDLLAKMDPALLRGHGILRVSYSNSRVVELREALSQLLHYPYGCVEQTTSSTLPWIGMRGLAPLLPELQRPEAEVRDAIQHGVDRLMSMQTDSGGLAYWPGGSTPLLYASAWGGFGIASGRKAGASVREDDFERLMNYLAGCLRGSGTPDERGDRSSQCLALYTLAVGGRPQPAYHERFFEKRASLDAQQRAWLALAILESNGPTSMVETLLNESTTAADDTSWWWHSTRSISSRLMAWSRHQPESVAVTDLVTQLLANRQRGHWYTTQGNAWAVLALSDYVTRVERPGSATDGSFVFNGTARPFAFDGKPGCFSEEFPLSRGAVPVLTMRNSGGSPIFVQVSVAVCPSVLPPAQSSAGYTIRRSYQKILDDGSLADSADLKVGDRVLVRLDVTVPHRATYLAVEDPLPATFEAINPRFISQAATGAALAAKPWTCDFTELREDRALFFIDDTPAGEFQISYLARVRSAGAAVAGPAKIEEMYDPLRCATSDTRRLIAAPWD